MTPNNPKRAAGARLKPQKREPIPRPSTVIYSAPASVVAALEHQDEKVRASVAGTVEAHGHTNKVLLWKFNAAKAMQNWPQGAEITEESFLTAIKAVDDIRLR